MELKTREGHLKLGSAYRLLVTAWAISWGLLFTLTILMIILITLLTGEMTIYGELVQGRATILMNMLPFFLLVPIIVLFHAFWFGGFLLFGLWVYRTRRPIRVVEEASNSRDA